MPSCLLLMFYEFFRISQESYIDIILVHPFLHYSSSSVLLTPSQIQELFYVITVAYVHINIYEYVCICEPSLLPIQCCLDIFVSRDRHLGFYS